MAVTIVVFNEFKLKQFNGNAIDLDTDTIKVALFKSDYTPDVTDEFFSEIVAGGTECSGTNYTQGGVALASPAFSGTTTVLFDATDTSWTTATITDARYGIIYKDTGNDATSPLIGYIDFGENKSVTAGTFTIQWSATDKVLKITSS